MDMGATDSYIGVWYLWLEEDIMADSGRYTGDTAKYPMKRLVAGACAGHVTVHAVGDLSLSV